jgi:Rrf2 family protein
MRLGEGVEWAAHCTVFLAGLDDDETLSAARLAEYHGVPAPYLAKALQALASAGLVSSQTGRRGGYRLARPADEITLLDVVFAVEGDEPAFRCTEIRQRGPARVPSADYPPMCGIAAAMQRAETAWRAELASTTVADIASIVTRQAPRRALTKTQAWLTAQRPAPRAG